MKQKLNGKNQNGIIIAINKNGNFKYLSIKKIKPRPDIENTKKKKGKKRRKQNEEETKATKKKNFIQD